MLAINVFWHSVAAADFKIESVATGLEHPWSVACLPDGRMLITERPGRLRLLTAKGELLAKPITGVPEVFVKAQGGLLDVIPDPNFINNHYIYFSYAEADERLAGTAVARAKLEKNALTEVEVIFRQQPKVADGHHFGSRLVFDNKGYLFITLGERFDHMRQAQRLDNHLGKVVRIHADGRVPADNPFINQENALPEIWSYGHRNPQGAALHPQTGALWLHEHGPRGGDEINLPKPGKNYGWPKVSYGSHYSLIPIPESHKKRGFVEPIYYWNPSIAPSGMVFYSGQQFPHWQGNLFMGALAKRHLVRLVLKGEAVVKEEKLLPELNARIRAVAQDKAGYLYVLTDNDTNGQLLRLSPRK